MIEFIVGGVRSGKSRYALLKANQLQQQRNGHKIFVATGTAGDGEMSKRIENHKKERDQSWGLIEEPLHLSRVLSELDGSETVLIDCLTLWVTNWLCADDFNGWSFEKNAFLSELDKSNAAVIVVSNEVGLGVTPMGELSRKFVDECGWLHQQVATQSDRVTIVQLGIPKTIKSEP